MSARGAGRQTRLRSYVDGVAVAGGQWKAAAGERYVDDDRAEHGVEGGHGQVERREGPEGLHEASRKNGALD